MSSATVLLLAGILVLAPAGCQRAGPGLGAASEVGADEHERDHHETGISVSPKAGLLIPPATAQFIGLQVADVGERKVPSSYCFRVQVYRVGLSSEGGGPAVVQASGLMSPSDAAKLRPGQAVRALLDEVESSVDGRIVGLNRDLEMATGQVEVLVALAGSRGNLVPGVSIPVTALLESGPEVASVPRSAILRTTEGDFVYTVSGNRFVRAPIRIGAANPEFAEVTDGLYAGDQVVVHPVMSLWMAELQSLRGGKGCADGH